MKHILLEDGDFKLEATEDNYDNVRITHTFKQGIHTDVDEIFKVRYKIVDRPCLPS